MPRLRQRRYRHARPRKFPPPQTRQGLYALDQKRPRSPRNPSGLRHRRLDLSAIDTRPDYTDTESLPPTAANWSYRANYIEDTHPNTVQNHTLIPLAFLLRAAGISSGLAITSCSNSILFATHTSVGLDVSGDIAKVPDHVNLGFRRREIAYVGKQVPKSASVLGKLDSQTNWNGGLAIRETFATGPAAIAVASGEPLGNVANPAQNQNVPDHPLVFASRTRIGFGFSVGGSDDNAIPSLHFGYTRRIATRLVTDPKAETNEDIPSVLADTSVHGSGIQGAGSAPNTTGVPAEAQISPGPLDANLQPTNTQGGIRIRQLFAVGKGATSLLKTPAASTAVKEVITQSPEGNTTSAP